MPGAGSTGVALRQSAQWSSILLSTGEQSAVSFTEDAGSRARCFSLVGDPLRSDADARRVTVGVLDNHGHLGRRVLALLDVEEAKDRYAERLKYYVGILEEAGPVAARLGELLALLDVARELCEAAGYPARQRVMSRALEAAKSTAADADRPRDAVAAVLAHVVANPTRYYGHHEIKHPGGEPVVPLKGWAGAYPRTSGRRAAGWVVAIMPPMLYELLEQRGYDQGVISRWAERGWLAKDSSGSKRIRVRVDRARVRAYALTPEALDAAGVEL